MLQIPKRALPSTASVRVPLEGDYGGGFADPVAIGHVRYEKAAGIRRTDYQLQDGTSNAPSLFTASMNTIPVVPSCNW